MQNNSVMTTYRFEDDIKRLSEIRREVKKLYDEKKSLEERVIEHVRQGDTKKEVVIDEDTRMTLVWAFDKKIDYERLQAYYPDVYELGIVPTFSKLQALKAVDSGVLNMILRDCTTTEPRYVVKYDNPKYKKSKTKPKGSDSENDSI